MRRGNLSAVPTATALLLAATGWARAQGEAKKVTLKGHELVLPEPVRFVIGGHPADGGGKTAGDTCQQ
jgi:hypothetical protein